jgi:hypothetical protein
VEGLQEVSNGVETVYGSVDRGFQYLHVHDWCRPFAAFI